MRGMFERFRSIILAYPWLSQLLNDLRALPEILTSTTAIQISLERLFKVNFPNEFACLPFAAKVFRNFRYWLIRILIIRTIIIMIMMIMVIMMMIMVTVIIMRMIIVRLIRKVEMILVCVFHPVWLFEPSRRVTCSPHCCCWCPSNHPCHRHCTHLRASSRCWCRPQYY